MKTYLTSQTEETEEIGARLAQDLASQPDLPRFVALYGDLGVGKTAFIRGFASVWTPGALVRSPTFTIVNEYKDPRSDRILFHFDLYRIEDEDNLISTGFYEYPDRGGDAVIMTEWSENIPYALPARYLKVEIIKQFKENPEEPPERLIRITEEHS